jgi:hypothetical protein
MPVPGAERACVHASIALSPRGVRGVTQVRVAHEQRPAPPPASATAQALLARNVPRALHDLMITVGPGASGIIASSRRRLLAAPGESAV